MLWQIGEIMEAHTIDNILQATTLIVLLITLCGWMFHIRSNQKALEEVIQVWVAGHAIMEFTQSGTEYIAWDILGVFLTEERALAACHNEDCFVGPLNMDEALPSDIGEWPGCYYPYAEEKENA